MATELSLSPGGDFAYQAQPDCEEATECGWFETLGAADPHCANRDSMFCHKRLQTVFAPHNGRPVSKPE